MAQLPYPTDDIREIVSLARSVAESLFTEGHAFLKAGVGLIDIVDKQHYQFDLLHHGQSERADRVMRVLDKLIATQGSVFLASQGVSKPWYMRQQYTTQWAGLPLIKS